MQYWITILIEATADSEKEAYDKAITALAEGFPPDDVTIKEIK